MINYKEKLHDIKAFVFDFDGVMTDGNVWTYADGDKRKRCVFLTPLGRELAGKVVSRFYEVEEMAFRGFSEEEQACCLAFCERMLENLAFRKDEGSGEAVSSASDIL